MRKEIDSEREKIIMNDLRTIGETTTRGGTQYMTMHGASLGAPMTMSNSNQYGSGSY